METQKYSTIRATKKIASVWGNGTPKSELELLLEKNRCDSLTNIEMQTARFLIANAVDSVQPCFVCPQDSYLGYLSKGERAIYDTSLCKAHARYALEHCQ